MSEFVVDVPPGLKPGDRFSASVSQGLKVMIQVPKGAVAGQPLNIKLNPSGGDAIILDPAKHNIFMAICPKGKKPGDNFDVTDPRGTRMRVIVPHGVKPGQRFSVRGRGNSTVKTGHSADKAPAYAIHQETRSLGAVKSKSKIGFNWRFVYIREKELREHSLFVKFSNNTRNLRLWLDGKAKIDTTLPPAGSIIHPITIQHRTHKLVVKLLFNETIEADFTIDGFEFDHLPQPDQTTSREVCIPSAIALRKGKENVGKRIASSKVKHSWEISFPGSHNRHLIILTWSQKNVKVFLDKNQILAKPQASFHRGGVVFEHIFPCQGVECRVEILRLDEGDEGDESVVIGLHIGGISFADLPKSQHEYDQKHSKELVAQLKRTRRDSTSSGSSPSTSSSVPASPKAPSRPDSAHVEAARRASRKSPGPRQPTAEQVQQLSQMGFSINASRASLEAAGCNMHKALDFLIANKKASESMSPAATVTKDAGSTPGHPKIAAPAPAAAEDDLLSDLFSSVAVAEPTGSAPAAAPVAGGGDGFADLFSSPAPAPAAFADDDDPFTALAMGLGDTGPGNGAAAAAPFDPFAPAPTMMMMGGPAPVQPPPAAAQDLYASSSNRQPSGFVPPSLPSSSQSPAIDNDPFAGLF